LNPRQEAIAFSESPFSLSALNLHTFFPHICSRGVSWLTTNLSSGVTFLPLTRNFQPAVIQGGGPIIALWLRVDINFVLQFSKRPGVHVCQVCLWIDWHKPNTDRRCSNCSRKALRSPAPEYRKLPSLQDACKVAEVPLQLLVDVLLALASQFRRQTVYRPTSIGCQLVVLSLFTIDVRQCVAKSRYRISCLRGQVA